MISKVKVCALDRLLLGHFGDKVGRGLALELSLVTHSYSLRGIEHHGTEHHRPC